MSYVHRFEYSKPKLYIKIVFLEGYCSDLTFYHTIYELSTVHENEIYDFQYERKQAVYGDPKVI